MFSGQPSSGKLSINVKPLSALHPKIDFDHLHTENYKLFSNAEIEKIKTHFNDNPDISRYRYTSSSGCTFTVLKMNDGKLYAKYYGGKHNKALGAGTFGKLN